MKRFAFVLLISTMACASSAEVEYDVRANLCKKRGANWFYVTESDIGYRHYQDFRCVRYDSSAARDTVIWP